MTGALNQKDAARYLGVSARYFRDHVTAGVWRTADEGEAHRDACDALEREERGATVKDCLIVRGET